MASYYSTTIVSPSIPLVDLTPLARHLLESIFTEHEIEDDSLFLYADEGYNTPIALSGEEVLKLCKDSETLEIPHLFELPPALLVDAHSDVFEFNIDDTFVHTVLQDVVRRSRTISKIKLISTYTCSKHIFDGYGGSATIITADEIRSFSTREFLDG